ncbi:hypothetical protein BG006_009220 [Podila minutissima]|uniref:F-box domain-containing protein n=1 Tax=Podila minutissima TaxID=64525 RepID=A0A9P5SIK7_9FUNG|nr:hypothetical protein BG006_009220 [Podila minutissima]
MNWSSPLSFPEILDIVASSVSPWDVTPFSYDFQPKVLLACALVCKAWRVVMLRHHWVVYHISTMGAIPRQILAKYIIYFRFIDEALPPWMPSIPHLMHPPDWEIPLNIKVLDWTHLGSDGNPVHFVNALSKLGHSVRELRFTTSRSLRPHPAKRLTIREHVLVFERGSHNIPTLAPLIPTKKVPDISAIKAKASSARYIKASILTVKHLTISVYSMQAGIQSAILEWRHQYLKWKRLQAEEKKAGVEPHDKSQKLNAEQGLDDLIIKLYSDQYRHPPRTYSQEFENGCSDLVAISTVVGEQDTADIFKYIRSFKHTLRRVDLNFLHFDTYFSRLFREILTTFTGLEDLRILTPKRFSRNVSASVFQRQKNPVKTACTTLKSLDMDCFYYGETVYRARKVLYTGDELWTWPAFMEGHRWAVVGRCKTIRKFVNTIMLPMKQLPELRLLKINGARIAYEMVPDEHVGGLGYEDFDDEVEDDQPQYKPMSKFKAKAEKSQHDEVNYDALNGMTEDEDPKDELKDEKPNKESKDEEA